MVGVRNDLGETAGFFQTGAVRGKATVVVATGELWSSTDDGGPAGFRP